MVSDCSSAADEVHDDRNQGKDQQQVNQKAADMKDEESAEPEQDEHYSQNQKHKLPFVEQIALPRHAR